VLTLRLVLWYFATVGALGISPFLAVRLSDVGLSDPAVTTVLMALPLGTLFGGPLWTAAVERFGRGREVLVGVQLTAAIALCGLLSTHPAAAVLAILGYAVVKGPIFPLADALTVSRLGTGYGPVRAVGSVGYIVLVVLGGALRDTTPLVPYWLGVGGLALAAAVAATLPPFEGPERQPRQGEWWTLLGDPSVRALLLVAFLNCLSLTTYDNLFALYLDRSGVSSRLSGLAIGWGVAAEVLVLFAGRWLLDTVGAPRLLLVACLSGLPRYAITALAIDRPVLVAATQGLHGLQFGAFWIAAVHHMAVVAPPHLKQTAQSLVPAFGFGLGTLCSLGGSTLWLTWGTTQGLFAALLLPATLASLAAMRLVTRKPDP
jgi:PPP family 3-phenylpropionic acid transporter